MSLNIVVAFVAGAIIFYKFLIWNYSYWKKRGIKGPKAKIIFGNFSNPLKLKRHMSYELQEIYESYKRTENIVGVYEMRRPRLLVTSAELVHRIFVNDFKHFHDNEMPATVDEKSVLANNPFVLTGEVWKDRRAEITPALTPNRIKSVFPVTEKVCATMLQFIEKQMKIGPKDGINASDLALRFSSEVVTDCVLGVNANSFSDQPLEAMNKVNNLFDQSFSFLLPILLANFLPSLRKFMKVRFLNKDSEQYFADLISKAIDLRKSSRGDDVNESRTDFLDYLLRLQEKKNLSSSRLIAYTMSFLIDGFETTGSTMAHCLLLLGRDAERQQQLRNEIKEKLGSSNDFDIINSLPYLDACIHETLRLFPPAFVSNKICTEAIAYINKNSHSLNIEKGDVVVLPLHAIMSDEDYYNNPQSFEPERFLEENGGLKKYKDMGVYYAFGDGPRTCLGMRFALAQMKTGLVNIVRRFRINVNPKTRVDNKFDTNYMLTRLDGGIWLEFENLK